MCSSWRRSFSSCTSFKTYLVGCIEGEIGVGEDQKLIKEKGEREADVIGEDLIEVGEV